MCLKQVKRYIYAGEQSGRFNASETFKALHKGSICDSLALEDTFEAANGKKIFHKVE